MYDNCSTSEYTLNSIMLSSDIITMSTDPSTSQASSPLPIIPRFISSSLPPLVVLSPCAACKILRRRCADTCMLAPYFPPTDPLKFTTAHRVFGASNIIKLLQDVPESQRADAVNSMVYEADARIRDPVYGCAGSVCQLQKQVNELKMQLARTQADLINVQTQYANLIAFVYMEMTRDKQQDNTSNYSSVDGGVHGIVLDNIMN
ncbi:LOB domain-containing protein 1-like protein [Carex littledalei]|uniref:LOB domain-containing protein 1-like protein n=1 Tax=Carex littledalei TaxID=544730 RepID=A0A833R1E1_9POAL|nr:LOB domain-containing protein 1-like protein [Carex littledalei]